MEAHVILAAKRAGISQCRRSDEAFERSARFQFLAEPGQKLARGCLLHEAHQRLEFAEVQRLRRIRSKDRRQSKLRRERIANCRHDHPAANIGKEFSTIVQCIHSGLQISL